MIARKQKKVCVAFQINDLVEGRNELFSEDAKARESSKEHINRVSPDRSVNWPPPAAMKYTQLRKVLFDKPFTSFIL